jgi:GT2 family glycosyltransferase
VKKLSVIIVNYNVSYFLEQALLSVVKACEQISAEIFVVDNNSADDSVEMVRNRFPQVKLIANTDNTGFSKANNQAIRQAQGEYIVLLNPDTLVEEDTFLKCCAFMDDHPEGGALGVKMIDGKGNFLPESKRGLPTPWVAFYKVFGLAALFPKSKRFGKYHLGYLDKDEVHEVEILSGAFMFLRKSALDTVGLLDEEYFMYGEDIDLSYRFIKKGYKNYYYPHTSIIHYKGESTKRTSINYVFVFYRAMIIFARKHFSGTHAGVFSMLIHMAIYLRAALSIGTRMVKQVALLTVDIATLWVGMYFLKEYWEENFKNVPGEYPAEYMAVAVPAYIAIWLTSVYFCGGYDKPVRAMHIARGVFLGTILISAISNFFDAYRFSKALIILGGAYAVFALIVVRLVLHFGRYRNWSLGSEKEKKIIIVGNAAESSRVMALMGNAFKHMHILGYVSPTEENERGAMHLGYADRIRDIIEIYNANEVIFCSKDISAHQIMAWMTNIGFRNLEYKIVPVDSKYIIGSSSSKSQGDFYTLNIEMAITRKSNLRNKRVLDIVISTFLMLLYPVLALFVKKPVCLLQNIVWVLWGRYTWVGFATQKPLGLPGLRKGVLTPASGIANKQLDAHTLARLDRMYARNYRIFMDLDIIRRSFHKLGNT